MGKLSKIDWDIIDARVRAAMAAHSLFSEEDNDELWRQDTYFKKRE
ncbi:MAG TPA: hypothetical protein VFI23_10575 [Rhizomicrobium sp.]|nr:hypothetical protein [Rhizomicrobium sp.]